MTSDAPLVFLARLLAAIANAHSPKTLAKELANAFHPHAAITRIEIDGVAIVRAGIAWKLVDPAHVGVSAAHPNRRELVPGFIIQIDGLLPAYYDEPAFLDALAHVIETAVRHVATIDRIATLSRTSYAKRRELRDELARAEHGQGLVARSSMMQGVLARVALVARHPTTVLVLGESGTGKELVARELHRLSTRAHRPFLQLNCGAIPPDLVETELFGHERGAFTGAERTHPGIFERANGGTLLLDEIGDLPLPAQAKLLRVLQERTVRRVGGTIDIPLDVRVIAATHRDLRGGDFREDLYYRLAVFQIEVPALRQRRGDIAPLSTALLAELAAALGLEPPTLSPADLARLEVYEWPGNVRELRNVLETMLITGELPELVHRSIIHTNASLDGALRDAIESALRASRGKIYGATGAAARLGLPPATLQSKMKKLGIARGRFT